MNSAKRICIDARFYRRAHAGVGRYTRNLIEALKQLPAEYDFTVILTPADHAEWIPTDLPNWHVKILDVVHYTLQEQTVLLAYLKQAKFDLVHFTMFNHPLLYSGPFIVTIHDLTMSLFPLRPMWHPRTWAYRLTMSHSAKAAQHIVTPSQSTANDIQKYLGIAKEKISITLEAVEDMFVPAPEKNIKAVTHKLGITKPYFFFLNAWRPHKGLPELIDAYMAIPNRPDFQLVVAGKPNPDFSWIINQVDAAKKVSPDIITPGFVSDEDMIALYSGALAYMSTTHYEGFGLPQLEALACGCPVISAKNSSLPEVLGDNCLYYETGDSESLKKAMQHLAADSKLQQTLSQNGLKRAATFSFDRMAEETHVVYRRELGS